jgi:hypothetical protein
MWFETPTDFIAESPDRVRDNITTCHGEMTSHFNGQRLICGRLEAPSLSEPGQRVRSTAGSSGMIPVREVVADVPRFGTPNRPAFSDTSRRRSLRKRNRLNLGRNPACH